LNSTIHLEIFQLILAATVRMFFSSSSVVVVTSF